MNFIPSINIFETESEARFKLLAKTLPNEAREIIKNYEGTAYTVCIGSSIFVFRPLTYGEFHNLERIIQLCGNFDLEDYVLEKALIWPKTPSKILATYPGKLTKIIIEISGWNNVDAFKAALHFSRNEMQTHNKSFDILLKTTFSLKDVDLNNMDFLERMKMIAWAEIITKKDFLEEKKDKKPRRIPGLNMDTSGIEDFMQTSTDEQILAVDKQGRPVKKQEIEQTVIYNTRLKDRNK